ncbi:MAG TPA: YMGG-like glycine zipper-containing protein [Rhizomicrobium sp.]|nr:YMGG-like glycine zipper-containing protein [Rhizomicrobium sp.]
MHSRTALAFALTTSLSLAACGTTPGDRAVSGGLLGAGTGAVIGSLAGHVGQGALIGGLGGALLGAVTSPNDLYMGEPPWHEHHAHYHHRHVRNCRTTRTTDTTTTVCRR